MAQGGAPLEELDLAAQLRLEPQRLPASRDRERWPIAAVLLGKGPEAIALVAGERDKGAARVDQTFQRRACQQRIGRLSRFPVGPDDDELAFLEAFGLEPGGLPTRAVA